MKHLILFFILIPIMVSGQGWERTYGGLSYDDGKSVQQTNDGGYIIAGHTSSTEAYGCVYLIRTERNGDTVWTKTYSEGKFYMGYSVQQTTDGGYVLTGDTYSNGNGSDVFLIKTDGDGDTLWTKTYGGAYTDCGKSVQQTNDGGYIITGYITSVEDANEYWDVYLIKTDSNGDTLWTKTFSDQGLNCGYSVQQIAGGGFIIAGYTSPQHGNDGTCDMYLIKTNSNGDTIWTKTYDADFMDNAYSVEQTTDGGYIILGTTILSEENNLDILLMKTDDNGEALWTKTYGGLFWDYGRSVRQTTDGGYILIGSTPSFVKGFDVYLIKTDDNGDTLWTRTFGGEDDDIGYSVQQTDDGGYILTGYTSSFGNGESDVYLIKTDKNGFVTSTPEIPAPNPNRILVKTIDFSGREISKPIINVPYIEIYNNGTIQKKMIIR